MTFVKKLHLLYHTYACGEEIRMARTSRRNRGTKSVNYNTYREAARSVQENPDDSMEVEYWGEVKIL